MKPVLIPFACLPILGAVRAAPDNDNFASAQVINGSLLQIDGTTVGATTEIGEVTDIGYGLDAISTVWYAWTAPRKGYLDIAATFSTTTDGENLDNDGGWISGALEVYYLNGNFTIFNLSRLAKDYTTPSAMISKLALSGGVTYFIRVSNAYNSGSPFTLLLSFTPTYSSAVAFTTGGLYLKAKKKLGGRVSTPADVTGIRVVSSGSGRAANVRYFPSTGRFTFYHVRRGSAPPRGYYRPMRYVVRAMHGGTVIGQVSRTFRVIR